ncbi:hypothetical protein Barb6_01399 [Bacteroidales bacterium Barb6]|nr:hypothetical protein Barb6_01399 [Bacteroidales bacterium Barb6]
MLVERGEKIGFFVRNRTVADPAIGGLRGRQSGDCEVSNQGVAGSAIGGLQGQQSGERRPSPQWR